MATLREKQLTTILLKERLERLSGKKVILKESTETNQIKAQEVLSTALGKKVEIKKRDQEFPFEIFTSVENTKFSDDETKQLLEFVKLTLSQEFGNNLEFGDEAARDGKKDWASSNWIKGYITLKFRMKDNNVELNETLLNKIGKECAKRNGYDNYFGISKEGDKLFKSSGLEDEISAHNISSDIAKQLETLGFSTSKTIKKSGYYADVDNKHWVSEYYIEINITN